MLDLIDQFLTYVLGPYDFIKMLYYVFWQGDGRWSEAVSVTQPRRHKRGLGRPTARWVDDIVSYYFLYFNKQSGPGGLPSKP